MRTLRLLDPRSSLLQVWVEGVTGEPVAGDEIIEVAEYSGPSDDHLDTVVVCQLKYSTTQASRPMVLSELRAFRRKCRIYYGSSAANSVKYG